MIKGRQTAPTVPSTLLAIALKSLDLSILKAVTTHFLSFWCISFILIKSIFIQLLGFIVEIKRPNMNKIDKVSVDMGFRVWRLKYGN